MNCLEVKNLKKSFKDSVFNKNKNVLQDLSFEVGLGRTTGFVGVNGAGKTTTLKCILGFIAPDQGRALFFDNQELSSGVKKKIGYLPERPYYYEFLTAEEFLKFHWQLSGGVGDFAKSAADVLKKVDLIHAKDRRLRSFSKGMLQRIGFAQALIGQPALLILDEPMSGLDPDGRILMKDIIKEEKNRGTSIFFSSHLLHDMNELCDDLVVIDQGSLLYQGPLQKFLKENLDPTDNLDIEKAFKRIRGAKHE